MSTIYVQYPQGGGGGVTGSVTGIPYVVGPIDGAPPNNFGGYIGSFTFYQQTATALFPGLVSSANQTFSGVKTFLSPSVYPSLAMGPVRIDGGNALSIGSTNLTNEVVGILPSGNGGSGTSTSWTQGSVIFAGPASTLTQNNPSFFWDNSNLRLGIGTNTPSNNLSFDGNLSKTIAMERTTGSSGLGLIVQAGGAALGSLDANGGFLTLRGGISTGAGQSRIIFQTYNTGSSGTTDNVNSIKMTLTEAGLLGIGTAAPTGVLHISSSRSGAPSSTGDYFIAGAHTYTDAVTSASGTVAVYVSSYFGNPTLAAQNANITTSVANTVRINGAILGGLNQQITNSSALYIQGAAVSSVTNSYGLTVLSPTGATNNYAATFTGGNVGMGVTDAVSQLEIASATKQVSSSEQLTLRSQRVAIVTGDLIGGIAYKSNDSNLTAPGIVVALTDAVAEATHTASDLSTGIAFYTTKTLFMSESMRISGAGFVGIGKTVPTVPLDIRGNMNINGSTSGFFGLRAADAAGNTTYTWPTIPGTAGQYLQSNGVGSLTFATITAASLVGSVSLVNQVVGNLPLTQTSGSISLTNQVSGILPIVSGGTGTSSFTNGSIPYASSTGTLAESNPGLIWDQANSVLRSNKIFAPSIALGSTTLTSSSGGATYTLTFPGTLGSVSQLLVNDGAGHLSWQNGLINPMTTSGDIIYGGASGVPTRLGVGTNGQVLTVASGTSIPTWSSPTSQVPTIQRFTTSTGAGSTGTYTPPANVKWIRVKMVGGGGGGAGSSITAVVPGSGGTLTSLGSAAFLIANGGSGGTDGPSSGGSVSFGAPAVISVSLQGGPGGGNGFDGGVSIQMVGGMGGSSPFGGAGASGGHPGTGVNSGAAAIANSGGGGGGGGNGATANTFCGGGGAAGAYIEAIIAAPTSYPYVIGQGGVGGVAGGGGGGVAAGGNGGSGVLIVEEYY